MNGIVKRMIVLAKCAGRRWVADNATTNGAALAFYCAFSIAPLLVVLLAVSGWILGEAAAYSEIGAELSSLFGPSVAKVLLQAIQQSRQTQGSLATMVSVISLLIGATTVLSALQSLLRQIWKTQSRAAAGVRSWIRTQVLSLGFLLALAFLLLVSLTISTGLSTLHSHLGEQHAAAAGLLAAVDVSLSVSIVALLFTLIFRYLPVTQLPWKAVISGGVITAALFEVGRWAVGVYLAHSTQTSAFGAAASFATLLLWLYYTSLIFLFGAECTACLGGLRSDADPRDAVAVHSSPDRRVLSS